MGEIEGPLPPPEWIKPHVDEMYALMVTYPHPAPWWRYALHRLDLWRWLISWKIPGGWLLRWHRCEGGWR